MWTRATAMPIFGIIAGEFKFTFDLHRTSKGHLNKDNMLTSGTKAPSFALPNHTGETVRVEPGEAGRPIALLFYPESGTYPPAFHRKSAVIVSI